MKKPLSREFLLKRGYCCNCGCVNCPYGDQMIIQDLDGVQVKWKIKGVEVKIDTRTRSSLHLKARKLLKSKFPTQKLLEEVSVPLKKGKTVFLDFYLPLRKIAIEVHGEQHYKKSSMFHATAQDFLNQKRNDREKQEWCEINGITHIVFPYNEIDNWEDLV